jgi:3-deoxy-D-manno-octulosonate 8-phosphate phosphatase KdsC-like HAD superfamily phosphatase
LLDGRGGVLGKALGGGLAHGDFEMKNGAGRQAVSMEGRKTMILTKRQSKGLCRRRHE